MRPLVTAFNKLMFKCHVFLQIFKYWSCIDVNYSKLCLELENKMPLENLPEMQVPWWGLNPCLHTQSLWESQMLPFSQLQSSLQVQPSSTTCYSCYLTFSKCRSSDFLRVCRCERYCIFIHIKSIFIHIKFTLKKLYVPYVKPESLGYWADSFIYVLYISYRVYLSFLFC